MVSVTDDSVRFEDLIDRHHDEIYAYVWRMLDGATGHTGALETADVVQDVFERAYRAFARLRPDSNYRAWLYKIATNCAYTVLRRQRPLASLDNDGGDEWFPDPLPGPEQSAAFAEDVDAMRAGIDALPPTQKAALVMRYLQGLDYDEIAAALASSEESARANVSHALRRLRNSLAAGVIESLELN
jgi:RNA polymerase sigma-70 factor, ECF subfamily